MVCTDKDFSIVIPVKDEADNLPRLVEEIAKVLDELSLESELILVDDGSTDDTPSVIRDLRERYPFVRWVRFDKNYGKSAALSAGFDRARGAVIVIMDADCHGWKPFALRQ